MNQVKILFGDDYELTWNALEHAASKIWFQILEKELKDSKEFRFRYPGFINSGKTISSILADLQKCFDVINQGRLYHIPEKAVHFDQDFANTVHHHFELLYGNLDDPAEYFRKSSPEVRNAIIGVNSCIHDLEAFARNEEFANTDREENVFAAVILSVRDCDRIHMPGAFHKYFTMNLDFGDMVLHYSQNGKTWLEVFYDNDAEIFSDNIRPQYALSGEFDLLFGKLSPDEKFLNDLETFLRKHGKDIKDPSLRLGHLPVAKLVTTEHWKTIKEKVGIRSRITRIQTIIDGKISAERAF